MLASQELCSCYIDLLHDTENSSSLDRNVFIKTLWAIDEKVWKISTQTKPQLWLPCLQQTSTSADTSSRVVRAHPPLLRSVGTEHTHLLMLLRFTRVFIQGAFHQDCQTGSGRADNHRPNRSRS